MWEGNLDSNSWSTCGLRDDSNDNRTRPISYAVHQWMITGGHYSDTDTYIKENGIDLMIETVNQIDHVMNGQWHWSNLLDVRSYRSVNAI